MKKRALALDDWLRDLAPSTELRKWFGHDPAKWRQLERRYRRELREQKQALERLKQRSRGHTVRLVYAARDEEHNEAMVLKSGARRPQMTTSAGPEVCGLVLV